jgi:hypothetical protein
MKEKLNHGTLNGSSGISFAECIRIAQCEIKMAPVLENPLLFYHSVINYIRVFSSTFYRYLARQVPTD